MFGFLKRLVGIGAQPRRYRNFGYAPMIAGGRTVREYQIGDYRAELMTDIESVGLCKAKIAADFTCPGTFKC